MGDDSAAHQDRSWLRVYIAVLAGGFSTLYLLTRSSYLTGGTQHWIDVARAGDPTAAHYGEPAHFLQVVLARFIWATLERLRLPVSMEHLFLALSLLGTVVAIVFIGLIAEQILRTRNAAWLAALLFGTSHLVWTQSNGELSGLAHGFVTAALFLTLRGHIAIPALLWALAVLSHFEFALAAPAFIVAVWIARPTITTIREKLRRALTLLLVSGATTVLILLLGSWAIGKWTDAASLIQWTAHLQSRDTASFEVTRAIKGLLTAFTVAGHYWRDIWTGNVDAAYGPGDVAGSINFVFVLAATFGLLVLAITATCVTAAVRRRRLTLFALVWLLPSHVLLNWRFAPSVEKHHAAALPGLILLVTAGLIVIAEQMSPRRRYSLYGGAVLVCAGLNLFGAMLPLQAVGRGTDAAERAIRRLNDERGGHVAFIACDDTKPLRRTAVRYLRIRSIWREEPADIQAAIVSWARTRLSEGDEVYVLLRWCLPDWWATSWSREPFDLFFLKRDFELVPTSIVNVPVGHGTATNPFSWTKGDVAQVVPRALSTRPDPRAIFINATRLHRTNRVQNLCVSC